MVSGKDIKDKTYLELNDSEVACLKSIIDKLYLALSERNIVWIALVFGETVFESLKRVRGI